MKLTKRLLLPVTALLLGGVATFAQPQTNNGVTYLMNEAVDVSQDFRELGNTLFIADHLESFDVATGEGLVNWSRQQLVPRQAFNTNLRQPMRLRMLDFPSQAYVNNPSFKFDIDFVTPRTIRVRMLTTIVEPEENNDEVMLAGPVPATTAWTGTETEESIIYTSEYGQIEIIKKPWRIVIKDAEGKVLTETAGINDNRASQVFSSW